MSAARKLQKGSVIVVVASVILLISSLLAGVTLVQQNQNINEEAASCYDRCRKEKGRKYCNNECGTEYNFAGVDTKVYEPPAPKVTVKTEEDLAREKAECLTDGYVWTNNACSRTTNVVSQQPPISNQLGPEEVVPEKLKDDVTPVITTTNTTKKIIGQNCLTNSDCESNNCQTVPGAKLCIEKGVTTEQIAQSYKQAEDPKKTNLNLNETCSVNYQCLSDYCNKGICAKKPIEILEEERQKQLELFTTSSQTGSGGKITEAAKKPTVTQNETYTITDYVESIKGGDYQSRQECLNDKGVNSYTLQICGNFATPTEKELLARNAINTLTIGQSERYIAAFQPENVTYYWETLGYSSLKACQDYVNSRYARDPERGINCDGVDYTPEQNAASIGLGTTLTVEAALLLTGTGVATGTLTGTAALGQGLAISTVAQGGIAADVCTLEPDSKRCKEEIAYTAVSVLNVGTASNVFRLAANSAKTLNIATGLVNVGTDAYVARQFCSNGEYASAFGCTVAIGASVLDIGGLAIDVPGVLPKPKTATQAENLLTTIKNDTLDVFDVISPSQTQYTATIDLPRIADDIGLTNSKLVDDLFRQSDFFTKPITLNEGVARFGPDDNLVALANNYQLPGLRISQDVDPVTRTPINEVNIRFRNLDFYVGNTDDADIVARSIADSLARGEPLVPERLPMNEFDALFFNGLQPSKIQPNFVPEVSLLAPNFQADDIVELASNPVIPRVANVADNVIAALPSTSTLTPDSPSLPQSPSQISLSSLWDDFVAKPIGDFVFGNPIPKSIDNFNFAESETAKLLGKEAVVINPELKLVNPKDDPWLSENAKAINLQRNLTAEAEDGPVAYFTKASEDLKNKFPNDPTDEQYRLRHELMIGEQNYKIGDLVTCAGGNTLCLENAALLHVSGAEAGYESNVIALASRNFGETGHGFLEFIDTKTGKVMAADPFNFGVTDEKTALKYYSDLMELNTSQVGRIRYVVPANSELGIQILTRESSASPTTFSKVVDSVVANLTPTRLALGAGTTGIAVIAADIAFDFSDLGIRDQIIESGQSLWSGFINLLTPDNERERGKIGSEERGIRNEEIKKESDFGELINENLTESQAIPDDCVNREILDTAVVGGNTGLRYNSSFEPDVVVVNDRIKGAEFSQFTDTWMVEEAVEPVQEWVSWVNEQGYSPFISSAYRSYETQEAYSRSYEDEAATQGASCHQSGLCFDVHYYIDNKTGKRYDLCYDPNKPECKINLDAQVKAQELGIAHPYEWDQPHYFVAVAASPAILPFVQQQSTRVTYIDELNDKLLKLQDQCAQYTLP